MYASFINEVLIPALIISAIALVATLFLSSRSRRARQAYEKGGVDCLVENLKKGFLKREKAESLDAADLLGLAWQKTEKHQALINRLEKIDSIKLQLVIPGIILGAMAVMILVDWGPGWLFIGMFVLLILLMVIGLASSTVSTVLMFPTLSMRSVLERAKADLASGEAQAEDSSGM